MDYFEVVDYDGSSDDNEDGNNLRVEEAFLQVNLLKCIHYHSYSTKQDG